MYAMNGRRSCSQYELYRQLALVSNQIFIGGNKFFPVLLSLLSFVPSDAISQNICVVWQKQTGCNANNRH